MFRQVMTKENDGVGDFYAWLGIGDAGIRAVGR